MRSARQIVKCIECNCSVDRDSAYPIEDVDPIDMGEFGGYITIGYVCEDCMGGGDGGRCGEAECGYQ